MSIKKPASLLLPAVLGLAARLIALHIDIGLSSLNAPPGTPPLWALWCAWTLVLAAPGIALTLTLSSGDARRYRAVRLLVCSLALYNLWPLIMAGRLWLNMSCLLGLMVAVTAAIGAHTFWKINRVAGLCEAAFAVWIAFELYLTFGFAVLN